MDSFEDDGERRQELLTIEFAIFQNIKKEVEKETGNWCGSRLQNDKADMKVASSIYASFKNYEDGMKRRGSFFMFKRM